MEDSREPRREAQVSYPGCYPAGVFIVASVKHLRPLVSRLRDRGLLKAGRNVTPFDAKRFAELESTQRDSNSLRLAGCPASVNIQSSSAITSTTSHSPADGFTPAKAAQEAGKNVSAGGLTISRLHLYEVTEEEARTATTDAMLQSALFTAHEACSLITLPSADGARQLLSFLQLPRTQRAQDTEDVMPPRNQEWPLYMAVHVNGDMSNAELMSCLEGSCLPADEAASSPSTGAPLEHPPVAFVRDVRRFHRVCCRDLHELPSALAALRQSALLQRCRAHVQHLRECCPDSAGATTPSTPAESSVVESRRGTKTATPHHATPNDSTGHSKSPSAFTFSELFGGIGMFRTALERVGGRATFAVEFAPPAQMVYACNHSCWHDCPSKLQLPNAKILSSDGTTTTTTTTTDASAEAASASVCPFTEDTAALLPPVLVGDITEIPSAFFPPHDVLTGGFPCQSFAKAGAAAGLHAEKGWLFYEVVRVLAAARPAAFLLENVEHLVEVEAGAQLHEILHRLRYPTSLGIGGDVLTPVLEGDISRNTDGLPDSRCTWDAELEYEVRHVVVDGGVLTPQTRRRVYFFGFRKQHRGDTEKNSRADHFKSVSSEQGDGSVAATVIVDALHRLQQAAATAPYRSVQDLLVAPSTSDYPPRTPEGGRNDQSAPLSTLKSTERTPISSLQLTSAQWEAVQRSHTFRQNPMWRVCDVAGKARTLLGSYRTSYQLYSEFVPYAPTLTLQEVRDALAQPELPADESNGGCGEATEARVSDADTTPPPPPLRFYAIRECARLQGIADSFRFPHDGINDDTVDDSGDATKMQSKDYCNKKEARARIPPAVLRQVPSGAVYKLIGNAVNPCVVECLSGAIAAQLQKQRGC